MCPETSPARGSGSIPGLSGALELLPGRLYWSATDSVPKDNAQTHFFSIDKELVYEPFCSDFGPLNLASLYRYCKLLRGKLSDQRLAEKRIVHCCSADQKKRANAACLAAGFLVVVENHSAKDAWDRFRGAPPFLPFRDAINGPCSFQLSIFDCLEGLSFAMSLGWFSLDTFDLAAYDSFGRIDQCDAHWIVPEKFVAFTGPSATSRDPSGFPVFTPEECVTTFTPVGITLVIRLNNKQYDRRRFTDNGIKHLDLYFQDGSCPASAIISKFLLAAEAEPGAVAVHCKAGLGRTCTLIGLYAMKHLRFPPRAFIGWARICRPGSVLGPQQQFLVDMQQEMFQLGSPKNSLIISKDVQGPALLRLAAAEQHQDVGQGERLCGAKRSGASGARSPGSPQGPTPSTPPGSSSVVNAGMGCIAAARAILSGSSTRASTGSALGRALPPISLPPASPAAPSSPISVQRQGSSPLLASWNSASVSPPQSPTKLDQALGFGALSSPGMASSSRAPPASPMTNFFGRNLGKVAA